MRRRRARHSPDCRHCPRVRALGLEFGAWRHSWELAAEYATSGYATEAAEYATIHRPPTFRDYLLAMAGSGYPMSGQAPTRALIGKR